MVNSEIIYYPSEFSYKKINYVIFTIPIDKFLVIVYNVYVTIKAVTIK